MAEAGEELAATYIKNYIEAQFSPTQLHNPIRYDNLWFESFPPENNEWVKGVPDYVLAIETAGGAQYFKTEIKLKVQEFRKTSRGGTTTKGSYVPNYGCSSYYLDVTPVHSNMVLFCNQTNIPASKFIIAFINPDEADYRLITLEEINNLLSNGWNGTPIATFAEGYGQPAYLIPKDATRALNTLTQNDLLALAMNYVVIPS
jgi:hypothetical protein